MTNKAFRILKYFNDGHPGNKFTASCRVVEFKPVRGRSVDDRGTAVVKGRSRRPFTAVFLLPCLSYPVRGQFALKAVFSNYVQHVGVVGSDQEAVRE